MKQDKELSHSEFLTTEQIKSIKQWISKMKKRKYQSYRRRKRKARHTLNFQHKIIGNGRHRIVYDLSNGYVLKVAISKRGLMNNKNESILYAQCSSNLKKYLCSVKEYGYGWIVMKKMKPLKELTEKFNQKLDKIKNKFLLHGIIPYDLKGANMAYSRKIKRIVFIDYGDFKKI